MFIIQVDSGEQKVPVDDAISAVQKCYLFCANFLSVCFVLRTTRAAARCEVYFYTSVMKYCQAMRPEKKKTPLSAGLMEVSPYFMSFPQLSVGINLTRDESCFSSSSLYFPS